MSEWTKRLVVSDLCPPDQIYLLNPRFYPDGTLDMDATCRASSVIVGLGKENVAKDTMTESSNDMQPANDTFGRVVAFIIGMAVASTIAWHYRPTPVVHAWDTVYLPTISSLSDGVGTEYRSYKCPTGYTLWGEDFHCHSRVASWSITK